MNHPQYGKGPGSSFSEFAHVSRDMRTPRAGTVRSYDPERKLYKVSVEGGIGDRDCRMMLSGLDKPLSHGSSCIVMPVVGRRWVIIGELDLPSRAPDKALPESGEQEAAIAGQMAAAVVQRNQAQAPNYRPVDLQGMGEEPQFVGDASLENRRTDHIRRSRVKVYSFGDILIRASALCYSLYHRATNTIYRRCRNELFEAHGVQQHTVTPAEGDLAGKTTRRLTVRHDALRPEIVDKLQSAGKLLPSDTAVGAELFIGPIANRGERVIWGLHRVEEIDNDTGTVRTQQELGDGTRITSQVGDLTAENAAHPVSGVQNPSTPGGIPRPDGDGAVEHGAHYQFAGGFDVTIDAARGELQVLNTASGETHRVVMAPDRLVLERGGQSFRLDASGLTIKVKKYTLAVDGTVETTAGGSVETTAGGSVETTAGGNVTINAPDMDVNLG